MFLAELNPILKNALIYGAIGGAIGAVVGVIRWAFTNKKKEKEKETPTTRPKQAN